MNKLEIKGDKSKEGSLSNLLANLKKSGTISADGGKYVVV